MKFELDNALIDDILFHMENQYGEFLLDTHQGMVVDIDNFENEFEDDDEEDKDEDDDRYIDLPEWTSDDGFRLMEKFTGSLKNPVLREELSAALNRKKGVFRAFKDTLEQYPETEKQWYAYKEKKMKAEVIDWYNALREEWGLEPIGAEPEDTSALVLEDFVIREHDEPDCALCFIAETADGQQAGTLCAKKTNDAVPPNGGAFNPSLRQTTDRSYDGFFINKLEVKEEYRGMGLGKTLLAKFLEKAGGQSVTIDLPSDADYFARSLLLEGFELTTKKFKRK